MHTHSYTQDIADKHTHTYIHTCTSTSWIHTHSLSVPACVLFHRFSTPPRESQSIQTAALVSADGGGGGGGGGGDVCVVGGVGGRPALLCVTPPLFPPGLNFKSNAPPFSTSIPSPPPTSPHHPRTAPAPPPPPPFSQIWSLSTPLLCPTPPASFPSLPLAPPSPPPPPFFPSVCLSPFLFRCTKCFKFIICILWCMGTIMFFIMEKWERFIFVTGLFHNSFFKLVL